MDLDTALTDKPAEGASATDILRADHRQVKRLFADFDGSKTDAHASQVIAQALCLSLELHDAIEREVFYPAVLEIEEARVKDAFDAHAQIQESVEEVKRLADSDRPLAQAVASLRALVEAHVREEEERLFRELEKDRRVPLRELGLAIIKRKEELTRSTGSFEAPAT